MEPTALTPSAQPTELSDLAMSPQAVLKQAALIQQVMQSVMRDGEHYGVIPGTSGKKSLLKSGAEKLCFTFGLSNRLDIQVDNLPNGHREYRIICNLFDRSGNQRGQGVGSASTMESKHRYRGAAGKPCPKCGSMACQPSKKDFGGGYYCNAKAGGCGWSTKAGTAECKALDLIPSVRQENQDPADQYNTVLKMAKKRALVDAVLTATAASDIFAQDLEDLEDKIHEDDPAPAAARTAPAGAPPAEQPAKAPEAPAHPAVAAARELYRTLEKQEKGLGKRIIDRLCKLAGGTTPQTVPADHLEQFGKDVAALAKEPTAADATLAEWEREATAPPSDAQEGAKP